MLDLENDLMGLTRTNSHCPSDKHLPTNQKTIQRENRYKGKENPFSMDLKHMNSCQMNNYNNVPYPAPMQVSSCSRRS
jgi:hypothetical protein